MASVLAAAAVLAVAWAASSAHAYTINLGPHVTSCFHQDALVVNERIAFSFAVQAGGNFDIDWTVKDPTSVIIHSGNAEKEGEFIFIVDRAGEYTFCFSNAMSTFAEKTVNFEIMLSSEAKSNARRKAATGENAIEESAAPLEESLGKVREGLLKIERSVRYYKTREKVFVLRSFFNTPSKKGRNI